MSFWPWSRPKADEIQSRDNPEEDVPPIGELLEKDKVNDAVWNRSWQHPLVVFPLALGSAAVAWCGMIDFGPQAFGVALVGILGGGAVYVTNYFIRGEKFAEDYVNDCRRRVSEHKARELAALSYIASDCDRVGFTVGAKEASEVTQAYRRLAEYLDGRAAEANHLTVDQWQQLAVASYRQGMSLISRALALYKGLSQSNPKVLKEELKTWRGQLKKLKDDKYTDRDILERKIQAHERRLDRYEQSEKQVEALIAEANELESALDTAYHEVVDLLEQRGQISQSRTEAGEQTQLSRALEAARRVEQRLGNIGNDDETEDDLMYRQAGQHVAD